MKILIVISNSSIGGSQKVAMHLASYIENKENYDVKLIALKKTSATSYDMSRHDFQTLGGNTILALRKVIKDFAPDIVLSMGVPMAIYTVPACIFTGAKHIISERNDPSNFAGSTLVKHISRLLMKSAKGFVFQTKDAQGFYHKNDTNSIVIHNPLFSLDDMPKQRYDGEREKVIVSVGRLNKQKNQKLLIDAFAKISDLFPDMKLVIYGEGEEREALQKRIDDLCMSDKVLLAGATSDILNKIEKASIFVLPSDFEGMPNALMEAMAMGLPCISTDCPCGGPNELITNEENGILVKVNAQKELETALINLLQSKEKQTQISKKAMTIRKTHSATEICEKWLNYFHLVLKRK